MKKSRSDIHLLRALSLILVLLFHAEIPPFRAGFIGVDIFFLISGYLITRALDKPNFLNFLIIKNFYARRVRRIAPALLATISIVIPIAFKLMYPVQLSMFSQSIVATIFNLSNIYFLLTGGYFGPSPKLNPLLHTWSIGVEMQFYFLFPLIFWSIRNFGLKVRITAIAMLAILSLAAAEILAQNLGYLFGFFMMPTRLWQFLIGSFVYLGTNNKHYASSLKLFQIGPFIGTTIIIVSAVVFKETTRSFGFAGLIPLSGGALVLFTSHKSRFFMWLSNSWIIQWLGNISYATYLVHWPIFSFFRIKAGADPSTIVSILLLLISLFIGSILYFFLDRIYAKIFSRNGIATYLAVVLVISSFGFLGYKMNGFDGRNPKHLPKGFLATLTPEKSYGNNHTKCSSTISNMCDIGFSKNQNQQRYLLIGDSHSSDLSGPFRRYVLSTDSLGQQMSVGGCNYLTRWEHFDHISCDSSAAKLHKILISRSDINLIYVSDLAGYAEHLDMNEFRQLQNSLTEFIKDVTPRVRSLIILSARPHLNESVSQLSVDPKTDWAKLNFKSNSIDIVSKWNQFMIRQSQLFKFHFVEQLSGIDFSETRYNYFFNSDGLPIYRDESHLSRVGSELVFGDLKKFLSEQSD